MRVNVYLELPATVNMKQYDDSSAVTFWGKRDLRAMLHKALEVLDSYYEGKN